MSQPFSYATPLPVDSPNDCFFYHRINIPGLGEVGTQWDLLVHRQLPRQVRFSRQARPRSGRRGRLFDLRDGKRGAEVVSFDMVDGTQWDVVPRWDIQDMAALREQHVKGSQRLKNAYWFTHKRLAIQSSRLLWRHLRSPWRSG